MINSYLKAVMPDLIRHLYAWVVSPVQTVLDTRLRGYDGVRGLRHDWCWGFRYDAERGLGRLALVKSTDHKRSVMPDLIRHLNAWVVSPVQTILDTRLRGYDVVRGSGHCEVLA